MFIYYQKDKIYDWEKFVIIALSLDANAFVLHILTIKIETKVLIDFLAKITI